MSSAMLVLASGLLALTTSTIAVSIQVQLDRFEQETGFNLADATRVRVRKFNRTTSVLDGGGDVFFDVGDNYTSTLTVAYSRLGNNQFNEYPMKISKAKVCELLNGPYKEYQHLVKDYSNLPQIGKDRLCPLPRGYYWVKNWAPDNSWVPPVVPGGYWRFTFDLMDLQDTVLLRYRGYAHLIKGIV
ncbi:hypothetical protein RP20_CCG012539 [Aedes albopictus]|nr:hypothetical protein RP20_CCG012539 [Aedes albopictus]